MERDVLIDNFFAREATPELPYVLQDEVEVLDGVYAGKRGEVVVLDYATTPLRFLVEFGDGTDELFPASSLRLVHRESHGRERM